MLISLKAQFMSVERIQNADSARIKEFLKAATIHIKDKFPKVLHEFSCNFWKPVAMETRD
jgi:hypothetical protein